LKIRFEIAFCTKKPDDADIPVRIVKEFQKEVQRRCIWTYAPVDTTGVDLYTHCDKLGDADQKKIVEEFFKCLTMLYIKSSS